MLSSIPFFHPEIVAILEEYPPNSAIWKQAADTMSLDIKGNEGSLAAAIPVPPGFKIVTPSGVAFTLVKTDGQNVRLYCELEGSFDFRPMIELSIENRVKAYRAIPDLFTAVQSLGLVSESDEKAAKLKNHSILNLISSAFNKSKDELLSGPILKKLLEDLKQLRITVPNSESDLKSKASWFKRFGSLAVESDILKTFFKSLLQQMPEFWARLTFAQKIKVASIAPVFGAVGYLGGIGVAGGGAAFGMSGIILVLVVLFFIGGLVDFLDFLIKELSIRANSQANLGDLSNELNKLFQAAIKTMFSRDIEVNGAEPANDSTNKPTNPEEYEKFAVNVLAKKYEGDGFVTRYVADGGVDGYIVCHKTKEVFLIQAKYTNSKDYERVNT